VPTAEQRTISLFTGKTDLEVPHARDGSEPDPEDSFRLRMRPKPKWKQFEGLTQYHSEVLNAMIIIERDAKSGPWRYRVVVRGIQIGVFDNISVAADAAEGIERRSAPAISEDPK
jgi:hypothetical protein